MSTDQPCSSNSMSNFQDVAEFHRTVLQMEEKAPQFLDATLLSQRVAFMFEELAEFRDAYHDEDLVGAADALADLVYVALGTAYQMGLPFDGIWDAVHNANMTKVPGLTKRNIAVDAKKPAGWVGPEAKIQAAIQNHATTFEE